MKINSLLLVLVLKLITYILNPLFAQQVDQPITVEVRFEFGATTLGMMPTFEENYCTIDFHNPHLGLIVIGGEYQGAGPHSIFETRQIQVPVGRKLKLSGSSLNIEQWEMLVVPPPGYSVVIDEVPSVYKSFEPGGAWNVPVPHSFELTIMPDTFEGLAAGETTEPEIGRFIWNVGLGYAVNGNPSGLLTIRENDFDEIHKRENLRLAPGPNVPIESYSDGTRLRRVRTDILVDIEDITSGYTISFYANGEFENGVDLDADKGLLITGSPWRRIQVLKVGGIALLQTYHLGSSGQTLIEQHAVQYTVFLFESVICDDLISESLITLCGFNDLGPGEVAQAGGFNSQQATAKGRQVGVDVVIADTRSVFHHLTVAHPMVADFASSPVASCEDRKVSGVGSVFERFAGVIVSQFGFRVVNGGVGATYHDQCARSPQAGFDGFYGVDAGRAAVDASVAAVRFFDVGKKGGL